jgi:thiamine kinase
MAGDEAIIGLAVRRLGLGQPTVEVLTGGSRNRCYAVGDGVREVVLRIAGADDDAYAVARAAESLAQRTAAAHGLAPAILLEEPGLGLTAMKRVAGGAWTRELARSPAGAARLGAWLRQLHTVPPPHGMRHVDFLSSLEHYVQELGAGSLAGEVAAQARRVASRLAGSDRGVLCHNDLHHLNIIGSQDFIQVVDWEYAGLGDPIMDFAAYLAYHDLDAAALSAMVEAYGSGCAAPPVERLADARWLFEAVWWAWLELHRRLHPVEAAGLDDVRQRLAARLAAG